MTRFISEWSIRTIIVSQTNSFGHFPHFCPFSEVPYRRNNPPETMTQQKKRHSPARVPSQRCTYPLKGVATYEDPPLQKCDKNGYEVSSCMVTGHHNAHIGLFFISCYYFEVRAGNFRRTSRRRFFFRSRVFTRRYLGRRSWDGMAIMFTITAVAAKIATEHVDRRVWALKSLREKDDRRKLKKKSNNSIEQRGHVRELR